jgi:dipeptidyl aminopeptidase/acylaminoacyl peptidase
MLKQIAYLSLFISLIYSPLGANEKSLEEILKEEETLILERCQRFADLFYQLDEGEKVKEMTALILESLETKESLKQTILKTGRRFFLFKYLSDGNFVKGYISFVPNSVENPLLVFLRGGNRILGLMHPANDFTCLRNYTVITTTYRGGVSEGVDEFGGQEVNDVGHLVRHIPELEKYLDIKFNPQKTFILGVSRGGMEMFLALGRIPFLQLQIDKAASLSGILDLFQCLQDRSDMREMFTKEFGLILGENEEQWIKYRNPLEIVTNLRKDLPFLILQGTKDLRVSLAEGYHMVEKLQSHGNSVTYLEIPEGDHCLKNQEGVLDLISDWLMN